MAQIADLRAHVVSNYGYLVTGAPDAPPCVAGLLVLEDSAAHWGPELWRLFGYLLELDTDARPMLPEVSELYFIMQALSVGAEGTPRLFGIVRDQLRRFSPGNTRPVRDVAFLIEKMALGYLRLRFTQAPVDAPGAEYGMSVEDGQSTRILTMRWQPFTGMTYLKACMLLAGTLCLRRQCARLVRVRDLSIDAVDCELIPTQFAPPLQFLPLPPNADLLTEDLRADRTQDHWVLQYPHPQYIHLARARMGVIHRLLPVQTEECRRALSYACRRMAREPRHYDYMRPILPRVQRLWSPYGLPMPETHPWPSADAREGEPGPWDWAFHTSEMTSFIPINSEGGEHKWMQTVHARALLAERELLRRYIVVANVAAKMEAYAMAQHPRLGEGQPASTMPPELLPHIFGMQPRPTFRPFKDDMLGMLTRGGDEAWR